MAFRTGLYSNPLLLGDQLSFSTTISGTDLSNHRIKVTFEPRKSVGHNTREFEAENLGRGRRRSRGPMGPRSRSEGYVHSMSEEYKTYSPLE